ncbi:MAG TPA: hypothetical protein VKV05_06260 [Terriglobales bacterium]|nr:hypothetical protein [Terriglobales bacterium]
MLFAGLLSDVSVSVLGAILVIVGAVGWFRQVLPHEQHEMVPVRPEEPVRVLPPREVMRLPAAKEVQRAWLPLKIYPVSAGVKGGLAGGVAMAVFAMVYGVVSHHSIWYPINLLAGTLYAPSDTPSVEQMLHFHMGWFLFALAMHLTMCLLVGLLYGAMLPLLPTRPIVLGGIIGPLLWTGLLYFILGYVNPLLDDRINWWWFAASQAAFGIVAGLTVVRQSTVWTTENLPLAMRAGIEAPGLIEERDGEEKR